MEAVRAREGTFIIDVIPTNVEESPLIGNQSFSDEQKSLPLGEGGQFACELVG